MRQRNINDEQRDLLLNDKLKDQYDSFLRSFSKHLNEKQINRFKASLRAKLNGAYRYGLYNGQRSDI